MHLPLEWQTEHPLPLDLHEAQFLLLLVQECEPREQPLLVGERVGLRVGLCVGLCVGERVGFWDGEQVGLRVGERVGLRVGE